MSQDFFFFVTFWGFYFVLLVIQTLAEEWLKSDFLVLLVPHT